MLNKYPVFLGCTYSKLRVDLLPKKYNTGHFPIENGKQLPFNDQKFLSFFMDFEWPCLGVTSEFGCTNLLSINEIWVYQLLQYT